MQWYKILISFAHRENIAFRRTSINESLNVILIFIRGYTKKPEPSIMNAIFLTSNAISELFWEQSVFYFPMFSFVVDFFVDSKVWLTTRLYEYVRHYEARQQLGHLCEVVCCHQDYNRQTRELKKTTFLTTRTLTGSKLHVFNQS